MARARTTVENTKITEEVQNVEVAGVVSEDNIEPASKDVAEPNEAEMPKRKTVVMPRYLFTSDPDSEHHVVCYRGKNYQVKYDEPVSVPLAVAEVIENAIAQKKKVKALIKSLNGKAKEIQG